MGELRVPVARGERLPVVMIVNSSPGFDGHSAFYAEALNGAGIATLELDFMQGRGLPASRRQHMALRTRRCNISPPTRGSTARAW